MNTYEKMLAEARRVEVLAAELEIQESEDAVMVPHELADFMGAIADEVREKKNGF